MTKIDEYFQSVQRELEERFARMRGQNTDSSAKGTAAERIIGDLLAPYLQPTEATYRRQIIDSWGNASDEVDIAFCNLAQPSTETELLLAEGISYVLEVKSVVTDNELDRLLANAVSVKSLQRRLGKGDLAVASDVAGARYIDKIPYVGVAYESQLSFDALRERLVSKCAEIAPSLQPDAFFVFGRGSFVNSLGQFSLNGERVDGWLCLHNAPKVMLELVNFLLGVVPLPMRSGSALRAYLRKSSSQLKASE